LTFVQLRIAKSALNMVERTKKAEVLS